MNDEKEAKVINNDDHPVDQGLHAEQEDHWGTENNAYKMMKDRQYAKTSHRDGKWPK